MLTRASVSLILLWQVALAGAAAAQDPLLEASEFGSGDALSRRLLSPKFDDTAALTPLVLSAPRAPQPVRATDGRFHLVYELEMLNFGSPSAVKLPPRTPPPALEVIEVAVFADRRPSPRLVPTGDALAARMQLVRSGFPPSATALELGQSGIVFLDVTFAHRQSIPKRVSHRVRVRALSGPSNQPLVDTTSLDLVVDPRPVVVIGPFLRGGPWANFNGCCDFATPHRRVGQAVNGKDYWPERFAIDLLKAESVDGALKVCTGNCGQIDDWFSTGEDILAVADGVVTRVVDGLPNNPIDESPYPPTHIDGRRKRGADRDRRRARHDVRPLAAWNGDGAPRRPGPARRRPRQAR